MTCVFAYVIFFSYLCIMFLKKQIIGAMSMMVAVVHSVTMSACTPHSVREAESVVIQADSLWHEGKMYGVDEGDSATLAQAYETLNSFVHCTSSLCTSFAHACYHYGKLLRAKDDPVSAMQVFIDATHSRSHDYHILGRVYSNIGDICHLAGEFPLSYDMFEKSANMFLENGDTLNYYYGLNNMAFELAEQGKEEETQFLLDYLHHHCSDSILQSIITETEATLYLRTKKYDTLLLTLNNNPNNSTSYYLLKAQAYENSGKWDSALYYARKVMSIPYATAQEKYNVLYILINYDSSLSNEDLITLSALRSDIETDILTPLHNQWAMSVQLLEQDMNRKPDLRWVYAVITTIFILGIFAFLYIFRKRRQHQLIRQQVEDLAILNQTEKQRNEEIKQEYVCYKQSRTKQMEQNCSILLQADNFPQNIHWKETQALCELIDNSFGMLATKLQTLYHLSERETRLCILVLLGISNSEHLANLLNYGNSGIRNFKNRTAKKIGTNSVNLRSELINIALGEGPKSNE